MARTSLLLLAIPAAAAACGATRPAPSAPSSAANASAEPAPSSAPGASAQMVNATILTNDCKAFGAANARLAEKAMYQLTDGCTSVPGGKAEFEATLQPGGRISISAVAGQPDVVPICVLKHSLQHSVPLSQPCRLDVKLVQTSIALAADGGS